MSSLFASLPNPPSVIEYKVYKFLISDAPTDQNVDLYINEYKKHNVHYIVRACEPSYSTDKLVKGGMEVIVRHLVVVFI